MCIDLYLSLSDYLSIGQRRSEARLRKERGGVNAD